MTVLIAYQISPKNIIYQRMSCLSLIHDSRSSRCVSISRSPTLYLSLIIFGRSSIPTRSEISVFILLYRFLYLRPAHGKNFFNSIRHGTILSSCNPYFKLYRRLHVKPNVRTANEIYRYAIKAFARNVSLIGACAEPPARPVGVYCITFRYL